MKAVILLAGKGRRISVEYNGLHKTLIEINGRPIISYILDNIIKAGITEIVPVLGYKAEDVKKIIDGHGGFSSILYVYNNDYENTNNLVSLVNAKSAVCGDDFIEINGDMIFDYRILKKMIDVGVSSIAVDDIRYKEDIDSPKVSVANGKITDLGRHIDISDSYGYAVGVYRFNKTLAKDFFDLSEKLITENPQMGFHDPLRQLFSKYGISPISVENYLWMDVDTKEDIASANYYVSKLY